MELQEKMMNERLHLYDLDKNQLMEEQQQRNGTIRRIGRAFSSMFNGN